MKLSAIRSSAPSSTMFCVAPSAPGITQAEGFAIVSLSRLAAGSSAAPATRLEKLAH
jgi:hypothetical protein